MHNKDWSIVYSSKQAYLVEMAKQMLADQNIESVVFNMKDSAYLFGEIELRVKETDFISAKSFIDQFENNLNLE